MTDLARSLPGELMIFPTKRSFRTYAFPNLTGGLCSYPAQDNESVTLTNMETMRDGSIRTIWGSKKIHSNAINGGSAANGVIDLFIGQVYNDAWAVVAATSQPKLWAYATTDFNPSLPQTFTEVTPSPTPSTSPHWCFTQAADTSNRNIILAGNETNGLYKWDNGATSSVFTSVTVPFNPKHIAQYMGYTIIANDTTIAFSEYADPTTWPTAQQVVITGNLGEINGLASIPGRVIAVCRRGLVEFRGNTFDYLKKPAPVNTVVGTAFPRTVSVYGGDIAFLNYSGPYIFNSGEMTVQYIGEPIKEYFTSDERDFDLADTSKYYWRGHLTKHHYFLSGKQTTGATDRINLVFDRRLNAWWQLTPPYAMDAFCFVTSEAAKIVVS